MAIDLRSLSLVVLSLQNTCLVLTMRYTRTVGTGTGMYLASVAVACDEGLKLIVCTLVLLYMHRQEQESRKIKEAFISFLAREIYPNAFEFWRMCVPAIAYAVQKNLLYLGISNLDAAAFQVAYQGKILTTALFSFLVLGKRISPVQVGSLLLLVIGVSLVQVSQLEQQQTTVVSTGGRPLLGLLAVLGACCTSGFAAIYFEWILKKGSSNSSYTLWVRNFQLAVFAFSAAVCGVFVKDGDKSGNFFQGFSGLVWLVVSLEAFGGLVVAMVIKYADNILKTFATAISIVTSTVVSTIFLSFKVRGFFVLGAVCVLCAVYTYTNGIPAIFRYERLPSGDDVELGGVDRRRSDIAEAAKE